MRARHPLLVGRLHVGQFDRLVDAPGPRADELGRAVGQLAAAGRAPGRSCVRSLVVMMVKMPSARSTPSRQFSRQSKVSGGADRPAAGLSLSPSPSFVLGQHHREQPRPADDVLAAVEDVVDVLDERDARHVRLHLGPRLHELVVAHLGEVVDVDRHVQVFGEGPGEGRLAGARRAVEQPAALPRDALLEVPVLALPPQFDLLDEVLHPLREDEVVERLAVVRAGLAELVGRVREQPVVALLVPRQAVAAAVPLAVLAARGSGRGGCRSGSWSRSARPRPPRRCCSARCTPPSGSSRRRACRG